jgi:hypothetical protein
VPGILDWYLGKTGYKGQQLQGQKQDPNAPNNLYEYVPGRWSARGKFDDRSARTSAEVFVSLNRQWFAMGIAGIAAAAGFALYRNRR